MSNDIVHDFPIDAPVTRVFDGVSTPEGLDHWWTKTSSGAPRLDATYDLGFGPGYDWRAKVTRCVPPDAFELTITKADADWTGSRVRFDLEGRDGKTRVRFRHDGWPEANEHYRISCYCWAMYLRILKRWIENGEVVGYEQRLNV